MTRKPRNEPEKEDDRIMEETQELLHQKKENK